MGEAELAHDSKSLIPSLKWLETDLSDAVGRLEGWPTFGDIQQEGAFLQRRRLARRGQSHCAIRRVPTVKLWRVSNDPLSTPSTPLSTPSTPLSLTNLSLRAILHAWPGEGTAISRQRAGVPPPRDCFVAALLAMTPAWIWGAPPNPHSRDESLQLLLGFRIWSLVTQGDSPLCTPSQVWRPNEFSIPLSGRILGRVVG
jgi:hypothetical protein